MFTFPMDFVSYFNDLSHIQHDSFMNQAWGTVDKGNTTTFPFPLKWPHRQMEIQVKEKKTFFFCLSYVHN